MDTKEAWMLFHSPGTGPQSDEMLLAMLQELVTTIKSVERVYGVVRAQLLVRAMILDYQTLSSWAFHRGLKEYPRL